MSNYQQPSAKMSAEELFENFSVETLLRSLGSSVTEQKASELTIELAALREDKARLDWLSSDAATMTDVLDTLHLERDARNVIDAARKAHP